MIDYFPVIFIGVGMASVVCVLATLEYLQHTHIILRQPKEIEGEIHRDPSIPPGSTNGAAGQFGLAGPEHLKAESPETAQRWRELTSGRET